MQLLIHLSEGKALRQYFTIDFLSPYRLNIISLASSLYIFDALLFHERIILPLLEPGKEFQKTVDKIDDSSIVGELRKKSLLVPGIFSNFQTYFSLRNKLVRIALLDRRIYLITELSDYLEYGSDLPNHTKHIVNFKPKYESRYTQTPWKIDSILRRGAPLTYDAEACAVSLLTDIPVFKTSTFLPTVKLLNDSIVYAWDYVKEQLESVRKELIKDLIEARLIENLEVFHVPFTLSMVLREIPDSSSPSQLLDVALKIRKDKSIRKFREWLAKFHQVQTKGNLGEIAKARAEVLAASESLREEFGFQNIEQKIHIGFSDVAKDVFDDTLNILTSKPPKNIVKRFLDSLEIWVKKRKIHHLFFMQKLGRAGISVNNIKFELERCFGKSEDVHDLINYIKNYSVGCEKVEEIFKMQPRYLSRKDVNKFIKKSERRLRTMLGRHPNLD